uniref:MATE family efflux transporter n=1 Tax=Vibrio sp. TaxID=678 RepID=UPI001F30A834|nr:MATE family efflux transporter [Vibrio sp.]
MIAQISQTLMGFVDTVMAGQVSAQDVAAVALGNSIWLPTVIVVGGTIMAVPAMVAQMYGANRSTEIRPLIQQTIYMSLFSALVVMLLMSNATLVLEKMQIDTELLFLTSGYLDALMWGAPAFFLFRALRCFSEGMSITKPSMIIGFIGFFINIPANYIFIYGHFGMPALGGVGSGVATTIVNWSMTISFALYIVFFNRFKNFHLFRGFGRIDFSMQRQLIMLGMPIALAVFLEVAVFAVIAILLSPLGSTVVASNQIAVNFTMITLMVPLSIGAAVTVRVGYYLGLGAPIQAKVAISVGAVIAVFLAIVGMILILLFNESIANIYSSQQAVISYASQLLFFGAMFQIPNAIQTIYVAGLRGYKDTMPTLFVAFVSYWLIGMSIGYVLARTNWVVPQMGASGFWVGFIVGLTFAGVTLKYRLTATQENDHRALVTD